MQDKIIAAIAAYLKKNTLLEYVSGESDFQTRYQFAAEQIAAAIAPLVEAWEVDWKDAPPWAKWRTVDDDGTITFWELEPVLDDNQFFLNDNGGRKMIVLRPLDKQQRPK